MKIQWTEENTRYYGPEATDPPKKTTLYNRGEIYIGKYSTLVGARRVHGTLARFTNPFLKKKIGVLSFASPKKPGGSFINGFQGQVRFFEISL